MSKVLIDRDVVQLALDSFEHMNRTLVAPYGQTLVLEPQIEALRSALESAGVGQEPVAWLDEKRDMTFRFGPYSPTDIPLYTHPAPAVPEVDLGKNIAVIHQIVDQQEELQKYREALEMARDAFRAVQLDEYDIEIHEALAKIEEVLK